MIQKLVDKMSKWWQVRREIRASVRCNICHESYVGLAQDCPCTNWGGFIGI